MEQLHWNQDFSVGVAVLDTQHQNIIRLINLLISRPDATVQSETVSDLLDKLTAYSGEHFTTEEALLQEHGYPDLAAQKADHKAYRKNVVLLCQKATDHRDSVPTDLLEFMKNWWQHHILETDMKFRPFFEARGIR